MSYPWFVFAVWFADGYDGAYQATGLTVTEAMRELLDGFTGINGNKELEEEERKHGGIVKVVYSEVETSKADAEYALELARDIQLDANRILKVEEVTASSGTVGTPPQ